MGEDDINFSFAVASACRTFTAKINSQFRDDSINKGERGELIMSGNSPWKIHESPSGIGKASWDFTKDT